VVTIPLQMRFSDCTVARYALGCVAAVLLSGCGGSQPPIGAPGAMPQSRAIAAHADRSGSWMLPEAKGEDLLYISGNDSGVYVYTYPHGELVGTIANISGAAGECVDRTGDVFVTVENESGAGTIYEYAHGGTTPVETLSDPGLPDGCAVDKRTGDLAVANSLDDSNPYYHDRGDLAVYAKAQGRPKMYYSHDPAIGDFFFCAYDNKSNLYVSAFDEYHLGASLLAELPAGSSSFKSISLAAALYGLSSVQWSGTHLVAASSRLNQPTTVYRLRILGDTATVIGTTKLESARNDYNGQMWIQGGTAIGIGHYKRGYENTYFWPYPSGGLPERAIRKVAHVKQQLWGVTVSMGSSR
jgi:hypothetical protein